MSTRIRRPGGAAALILFGVLAVALAGCSSKAANATAAESVRTASQNSVDAGSVAFEMNATMEGLAGFDLDVTSEGAYDIENGQMRMTMDVLGQKVEAVGDGSTVYLKMPMLGDSWYAQEVDTSASGAVAAAAEDPTKVLLWLTEAGGQVDDLGTGDMRGENARHYRVPLDMREAAARLDGERRDQLEKAIDLLGEDTMDVDLWVNDAGLPLRLAYAMSFAGSELKQLQDASVQFQIDYFDWGKPVTVTLPDPADVKDLEGLLGGLLRD